MRHKWAGARLKDWPCSETTVRLSAFFLKLKSSDGDLRVNFCIPQNFPRPWRLIFLTYVLYRIFRLGHWALGAQIQVNLNPRPYEEWVASIYHPQKSAMSGQDFLLPSQSRKFVWRHP